MKELNPIIRNAVYTALFACEYQDRSIRIEEFIEYMAVMIPGYWEEPELLVDLGG